MSEDIEKQDSDPPKARKTPILAGVILAIGGGVAGYLSVSNGLILAGSKHVADEHESAHHGEAQPEPASDDKDVSYEFVALAPIVVNLPPGSQHTHLRLVGQLEVDKSSRNHVDHLKPRIADVMNTYLRALEPSDFEDRLALHRIRLHLLGRIESVVGAGNVHDFLITEFVLS